MYDIMKTWKLSCWKFVHAGYVQESWKLLSHNSPFFLACLGPFLDMILLGRQVFSKKFIYIYSLLDNLRSYMQMPLSLAFIWDVVYPSIYTLTLLIYGTSHWKLWFRFSRSTMPKKYLFFFLFPSDVWPCVIKLRSQDSQWVKL